MSKYRRNYVDLSGTVINNIKVIADDGKRAAGGNVMWLCECHCGKRFYTRRSRLKSGTTKSCGCYRKQKSSEMQKERTGSKHPNWNPNLTEQERLYKRDIQEVKNWRDAVYKRDGYSCVICGGGEGNLNAHHLDGWNWCEEKRFDVSNGVTLCSDHHSQFHAAFGKGNNTKEQFEIFKEQI